jgi:hypothetical protein
MKTSTMGLLLMCLPLSLQATDWSGALYGGGEVTVDEQTNRATYMRKGVETPLWDGTHKLQNGSILIIRDGIAVPNLDIMESRQQVPPSSPEEWMDVKIVGYSPCEKLVNKVCGKDAECSDQPACNPVRQLRDREDEERKESSNPNLMTYTSGQCLRALRDTEFFVACPRTAQD